MAITLMIAALDVEPGWAIGAVPQDDSFVDRDILLDASGHPWIPGSSAQTTCGSSPRSVRESAATAPAAAVALG